MQGKPLAFRLSGHGEQTLVMMMSGRRKWVGLFFGLMFALAACSGDSGKEVRLKVGDPAPDFTATDLSGRPVRLSALKGKPVVLRFWSTECRFCRADTPIFNRYFEKYKAAGLEVFYINRQGDEQAVRQFVADLEVGFPVILDRDGKISARYNIRIEPITIIISPEQRIVAATLGGISEEEFAALLGKYLPIAAEAPSQTGAGK